MAAALKRADVAESRVAELELKLRRIMEAVREAEKVTDQP